MPPTDFGLPFQIGIASRSPSVSLAEVVKTTTAINLQISRDFAPIWGVSASVVAISNPDAIDPGIWPIFVQDDIGADAAGFHLTRHNQPYALVQSGPTWSLTASHECLELLADPTGNRLYPSVAIQVKNGDFADQGDAKFEYLVEVCDPCEDEACAYLINDVLVSDFYTPHYFDPLALASVRYSFSGKITRPRQVLKNGYLSWLDPAGAAFQQARNFEGEAPEIIHIAMPPDTQKANVPLRGLVDRTTGRRQQSRLDPQSKLSQRQDERQNWLGLAAAVRAVDYQRIPHRHITAPGVTAAAPLTGAERARQSAAQLAASIARNRTQFAIPGVMTVRPGWRLVNGWPQPQRAIVVICDPTQRDGVAAHLPPAIDGVPLDIRAANAIQMLRRNKPEAYAAVASGPRQEYALPEFPGEVHFPAPGAQRAPEVEAAELMGAARAHKEQIEYTRPDGISLDPVEEDMSLTLHASPDAGWQMLKSFLTEAPGDLVVGMYDFTAPHIDAAVRQGRGDDGKLTLTLDHPPGNARREQTIDKTEDDLATALQQRLTFAWALEGHDPKVNKFIYPNAYHIKVAVRPDDFMWLSSGNWNTTNQPEIDVDDRDAAIAIAKNSDRDWHVVAHSPGLAKVFRAFLLHDNEVAVNGQGPAAGATAAQAPDQLPPELLTVEARPRPTVTFFPPSDPITGRLKIRPLLTPEDYQPHILALINSTETSFWMQTQYIKVSGRPNDGDHDALIAAVAKLVADGKDVRLITSEFEKAEDIEKLMDAGVPSSVLRIQPHVHNKGMIVDGKTVVVSSQNWSADGTLRNRDAGLIIYDRPEAAHYFSQIFLHDWAHLASGSLPGSGVAEGDESVP
jgi:PLD-like domain